MCMYIYTRLRTYIYTQLWQHATSSPGYFRVSDEGLEGCVAAFSVEYDIDYVAFYCAAFH